MSSRRLRYPCPWTANLSAGVKQEWEEGRRAGGGGTAERMNVTVLLSAVFIPSLMLISPGNRLPEPGEVPLVQHDAMQGFPVLYQCRNLCGSYQSGILVGCVFLLGWICWFAAGRNGFIKRSCLPTVIGIDM